jgi:alkylated DNA repair protein (DNA oxidative demethylase)
MTDDLFAHDAPLAGQQFRLGTQALLLRGFALPWVERLWPAIEAVLAQAPPQHLATPGGGRMSAALSNCGTLGWVSDARGYRYSAQAPGSAQPWPAMPPALRALGCAAAQVAGFEGFAPDSCLINRYAPGARMGLHQDRDERDLGSPIVSISLGLPACFLWGGLRRGDRPERVPLFHGDVLVWGGVDRLRFHGVAPVGAGAHPLTGPARFNLSLRRAG